MVRETLYNEFTGRFELLYKDDPLGYHMPVHAHNAAEIYYTLDDLENVLLGDKVYHIPGDSLIFIPSFCNHRIVTQDDWAFRRYILTVNMNWLASVLGAEKEDRPHFWAVPSAINVTGEKKTRIETSLKKMCNGMQRGSILEMRIFLEVMEEIEKLSGDAKTKAGGQIQMEQSDSARNVTRMLRMIEEHRDENITVEEISDDLHLNHDYCSRIFKKYTNTTIKQFMILQKMAYAKQMLLAGRSVSEIQTSLGYSTYEHFFKAFRKNCGMTPKEYKQSFAAFL